jgi:SAM-dependent methyltransferase
VGEPNRWLELTTRNPGHSQWYIDRFRSMAAAGDDLDGEARFVDALVPRGARILDAGCGPGRVGGALAARGHTVVGVDLDPELIAAAEADHPGPTWLVGDLAELDLPASGIAEPFDAVVCAGNVMTFLATDTRRAVLSRLGAHLADGGRIAIGFGTGRGYELDDYRADVAAAGLSIDVELATWDLRPVGPDADFLVTLLRRAS